MFYRVNALLIAGAIVFYQVIPVANAQAQTAAAAACASNPYCIGTVVIMGTLYLVLSDGSRVPYQGAGGYLENPEGDSEEWTEYVWGDDARSANAVCQQKAIAYGVVLEGVRHIRGKAYECRFRTYRT